jgi:transposase
MTMLPDDAGSKAGGVRRIEVFTGVGRRRRWSPEEKGRIVAESYAGVESVCAVARRYGLAQTQIFTWRLELRTPLPAVAEQMFVPVVVEPASAGQLVSPKPKSVRRRRRERGGIELEIGGVTVRVAQGADRRTLETVLRALKAER